jgi:ATP-dependent protease HslVU (ClpYQ) peptidase subunit
MSCVIGLEHQGKVYMGADSSVLRANMEARVASAPKVVVRDELIIGCVGSLRYAQTLIYLWEVPKQLEGELDEHYMLGTIVKSMEECLTKHGQSEDVRSGGGSVVLIGYKGKLYSYGCALGCICPVDGRDAIGCGADFALGNLVSSEDLCPEARILQALRAAGTFSGGVSSPYHVWSV